MLHAYSVTFHISPVCHGLFFNCRSWYFSHVFMRPMIATIYQESAAYSLYNNALSYERIGNLEEALRLYNSLLHSDFLTGVSSSIPNSMYLSSTCIYHLFIIHCY